LMIDIHSKNLKGYQLSLLNDKGTPQKDEKVRNWFFDVKLCFLHFDRIQV